MINRAQRLRVSTVLLGILGFAIVRGASTAQAQSNRRQLSAEVQRLLLGMDEEILRELKRAWLSAGAGLNNYEAAVLLYRMEDGHYKGVLQHQTNEYVQLSFKWTTAARAIIHTHPTKLNPVPSESDMLVAESLGVPVFTITMSGMYVYDPISRKTRKVQDNLDWLDISKWKFQALNGNGTLPTRF